MAVEVFGIIEEVVRRSGTGLDDRQGLEERGTGSLARRYYAVVALYLNMSF
jgi:hypothetical protein